MEQIKVVIFQLAQLQEVQTGPRALLQEQVHRYITNGGLNNHGHDGNLAFYDITGKMYGFVLIGCCCCKYKKRGKFEIETPYQLFPKKAGKCVIAFPVILIGIFA